MAKWKGLILAGGTGSRLFPVTRAVNKHLLPIYDKPMIYYPLGTLMLGGVRDFVIMCEPGSLSQFHDLLGDGSQWGITIDYVCQDEPRGIADGLIQAKGHLAGHHIAMILGDNIFFGTGLPGFIKDAMMNEVGATIFGYEVVDPSQFGVVELDDEGRPVSLVEKPTNSKSRLAVPGLYFYDDKAVDFAMNLKPSQRGELEVTDLNRIYLEREQLNLRNLGRGTAWLDGGTSDSLFEAGQFVKVVENRTGMKIACLEEIAYRMGFISKDNLMDLIKEAKKSEYFSYLTDLT